MGSGRSRRTCLRCPLDRPRVGELWSGVVTRRVDTLRPDETLEGPGGTRKFRSVVGSTVSSLDTPGSPRLSVKIKFLRF